jgi:hypothetical protein
MAINMFWEDKRYVGIAMLAFIFSLRIKEKSRFGLNQCCGSGLFFFGSGSDFSDGFGF